MQFSRIFFSTFQYVLFKRIFLLFLLMYFPRTVIAEINLPDIGTAAASTLSIDQELEYGDAYMRLLRSGAPIINDPVLNEYINSLGSTLVANANDVKTPFQFHLVNDRKINAFAFFGGYVVSNTGLFLYAKNESELASVLAHEIAHVTQRHLARRMENDARREPLTIASMIGALMIAIAAPDVGSAAMQAAVAGSVQANINYTRSNEQEADRFGIATLTKAGFNPSGMTDFFTNLAEQTRYSTTPPPMLLTHPLPQSRLTEARNRAQQYPRKNLAESLSFQLARARVVVRYAQLNTDQANGWLDSHNKTNNLIIKESIKYGRALAYLEDKKYQQAEQILNGLLNQRPDNNFYLDSMTDVLLAEKKYDKAINLLEKALNSKPKNRVLQINYINALISAEQYKKAINLLQRYTHYYPEDTIGWELLAKASGESGDESGRLAASGELLALKAQWDQAIDHYSRAASFAKLGSLEQARYDARVDQLRIAQQRFFMIQN